MMRIKFIFVIFLIAFSTVGFSSHKFVIEAEKNANIHNNMGVAYLKDGLYYAAIQEFKIAISINPSTQASATYYANLGQTYITISYPKIAQQCFQDALRYNPMNFTYYQNLVRTYKNQKLIPVKINEYKKKKDNSLSRIMLGLLYIESGDQASGTAILSDFCQKEPDLIITGAVKNYVNELTKNPARRL